MRIIKVSATESTNTLARDWYQSNPKDTPFCLITNHQIAGRGQRGTSWISNPGENLTMSAVFSDPQIRIQDQFLLSAAVALAVLECLNDFKINNLKLKWPNDIMSANYKIGGILIENIVSNGRITAAIIGIGLNINQKEFVGLPKASSLKNITGREFEITGVAKNLCSFLENRINKLGSSPGDIILGEYENNLYKKDKVTTFQLPDGNLLTGIIKGITPSGLLKVFIENEVIKLFDLKEIKLLF